MNSAGIRKIGGPPPQAGTLGARYIMNPDRLTPVKRTRDTQDFLELVRNRGVTSLRHLQAGRFAHARPARRAALELRLAVEGSSTL